MWKYISVLTAMGVRSAWLKVTIWLVRSGESFVTTCGSRMAVINTQRPYIKPESMRIRWIFLYGAGSATDGFCWVAEEIRMMMNIVPNAVIAREMYSRNMTYRSRPNDGPPVSLLGINVMQVVTKQCQSQVWERHWLYHQCLPQSVHLKAIKSIFSQSTRRRSGISRNWPS